MGVFSVSLEVADPTGRLYETVEAMVDSGATYTVLPASTLHRLGVEPFSTRRFVLADGSHVTRGFGNTWMRLNGREAVSPVVFWDEDARPLLGAVTLEILSLGIDPVNQRLVPVDAFMLECEVREGLPLPARAREAVTSDASVPDDPSALTRLIHANRGDRTGAGRGGHPPPLSRRPRGSSRPCRAAMNLSQVVSTGPNTACRPVA